MISTANQTEMIVEHCCNLFQRYGIKSVTMSDIADELGMSKKTLYAIFPNKADLVLQTKTFKNDIVKTDIQKIKATADNAIDELISISNYIAHEFGDCNPSMLFDMKKYYPQVWAVHEKYKMEFVYNSMTSNMERGIAEGLYREKINKDILTRLYLVRLESFFDHEIFPPTTYSFAEVHGAFINYHIRGIATEKGLKTLTKYEQDS